MFDEPVFKKLAHNDTGASVGHQGGILIPKDICTFFPPLEGPASSGAPTIEKFLKADLYVDAVWKARVETRYQHQTWGNTRSPERRLTGNLGDLRDEASKDDIALFSKDLFDDNLIRIQLIRKGTAEYERIDGFVKGRPWGALNPSLAPLQVEEVVEAEAYIEDIVKNPGEIFRSKAERIEARTRRLARDRAFRRKLLDEYDGYCCFTRRRFALPAGTSGLDGAHIVPVMRLGSDHPANGILLAKDMHWAFDHGLIGVGEDRKLIVPDAVVKMSGHAFLTHHAGERILEAVTPLLRASPDAFRWHRDNILLR